MIFAGLFLLGEVPFTDVIIHSTVLAPDGRRMSKSLGTGIDPMEPIEAHGADATRYGLLKISSTQDVRYSRRRDRGGPQAREQALERRAADPPERPRASSPPRARDARGALDPRAPRRARATRSRTRGRASTSRPRPTSSTTSRSTTSATGTPRRSSRASTTATRTRARRRSRALERLLALLHPLMPHVTEEIWSHLPDREARLIVSPWPEPDDAYAADARRARPRAGGGAGLPAQRRAGRARRATTSGASSRPSSGPSASRATATSRRSWSGSARRSRAPRGCSPTSGSSRTRPRTSSRRSAPSSSATAASSSSSAPERSMAAVRRRRLARGALAVAAGRLRARPDARASRGARRPAGRAPRGARRRHERQVDDDADDRGSCCSRDGPARRRVRLAARPLVGGADPRRRRRGRPRAALARASGRPRSRSTRRSSRRSPRPRSSPSRRRASTPRSSRRGSAAGTTRRTCSTATRVVVLTNVSLEHTDVLGETREAIAAEKLAVVRPGCTVVLGEPEWEVAARAAGAGQRGRRAGGGRDSRRGGRGLPRRRRSTRRRSPA